MVDITVKEIGRDGVRMLTRRGSQLVEVLPREEYEKVHLVGAVCVPLALMDRTTADRLKWDKPVIVYGCDSLDDSSARAAARLAGLGFTQVFRYTAGKADWLANGMPAEGAEARKSGAGDFADMDVPTCKRSERMTQLRKRLLQEGHDVCVVVNDEEIVMGLLRSVGLEKADPNWTAEEAMERGMQTFRLNADLADLQAYMKTALVDSVLVTTTDGKLFGLVRQADVDKALSG